MAFRAPAGLTQSRKCVPSGLRQALPGCETNTGGARPHSYSTVGSSSTSRASGATGRPLASERPLSRDEIVALVTDITRRKRAENADRFLADASALLGTSLDYNKTLPPWVDPNELDYLIVVGNDQFSHPGLREFARDRPVIARTDRYTVLDITGDREPIH